MKSGEQQELSMLSRIAKQTPPMKFSSEQRAASRTRRVLEGVGSNWLSFAITLGVRLFATPFYLARLGGELLGFNSFIGGVLKHFEIMNLGVGTSLAAIVAKELQPDASPEVQEAVRRKMRAAGQLQQVLAALSIILAISLAATLKSFAQGLPARYLLMAQICTVMFGFSFALRLSSNVFRAILRGKQLIGQTTLYSIVSLLVATGIGVLLVWLGWSLYGIAIASLVGAAVLIFQLRWRVRKSGISLHLFRGPIEWTSLKSVMSLTWWVLLASIGGLLSFESARIVLGVTENLGMPAVNRYSLLFAAPQMAIFRINRFSVVSRPGLTQLAHSENGLPRARRAARLVAQLVALAAAVAFAGILFLNGSFVRLWVGSQYYAGDKANLLAAAYAGIVIWLFPYKVLMEVRFHFRERAFLFLAAGALTAGLSFALAPILGIEGVLLSGIVGELVCVVPLALVPGIGWLSSERGMVFSFFSINAVPLLIAAGACVVLHFEGMPKLATWPQLILAALGFVSVGGGIGLVWLRRGLWEYSPWKPSRAPL